MKKHTRFTILAVVLLLPVTTLAAQRITRVAVIDYSRILTAMGTEGAEMREYNQKKEQVRVRIAELTAEQNRLEQQLVQARRQGNQSAISRLEQQVEEKTRQRNEYIRVQIEALRQMQESIVNQHRSARNLQNIIESVSYDQGYSMVMDISNPSLVWYSGDIDITEEVLRRINN